MNHLDSMTSRDAYQMRKYNSSARQVLIIFSKLKSLCFHSPNVTTSKCLWLSCHNLTHLSSPRSFFWVSPNSSQMSKQLTTADAFHDLGSRHSVGAWRVLGRTWGFTKGSKDKGQLLYNPTNAGWPAPSTLCLKSPTSSQSLLELVN